ncbi:BRO-like protein [Armadillidium vulgare iridescent virus]|uniref:BRO-like protein n=1 Tax=Armadillidium vulgare iridescent virus TaxID=72201 RepID=A0A068QKP5_9VIRU|nr:BRO-like protein [Armadillidium vulgare iridescent virus]CCV02557.1 BRO-like protein [Armadillidium vulgare iridescent virus]
MEVQLKTLDKLLNYNGKTVKVVGTDQEPWFCGKDVCDILSYSNYRNAISNHVEDDCKKELSKVGVPSGSTPTFTHNEGQKAYINEEGLYSLIFACKLPVAKAFKKWVMRDVLPSIRRSGEYKFEEINTKLSESMSLLAIERKESMKTRLMLEKEIKAKEEALQQKRVAEFRSLTLNKLCINYQERVKTQIFYVVSSEVMARDNEFKIGGVENKHLCLSMYNTGNSGVHPELTMNFILLIEIANYKQMEMRMKELLVPFRSKRHGNTENFNIHFDILKPLIEIVSENYNEEIDKLNEFLKKLLETHTEQYMTPVKIVPIDVDSIPDNLNVEVMVTREFGSTRSKKVKVSDLTDNELKAVLNQVLSTKWEDTSTIRRTELEKILEATFIISSHKRRIWDMAKSLIEDQGKVPKY